MGGNSTQQRHTEFTTHINPRNGGAIAVEVLNIYRLSVSIPAMGGNRSYCLFVVAVNEYQSPQWGAIADKDLLSTSARVSIPEMGGNSLLYQSGAIMSSINPRNGGQ